MNLTLNKIAVVILAMALTACVSGAKKKSEAPESQTIPKLKRPEVRKVWVPDQIVGDEFVSGHWKFVIEKNAVWTKSEEQ
jgi:hypothetical protein